MKKWLKRNLANVLYIVVALLVITAFVLVILRLSGGIDISYWSCLKPVTMPCMIVGVLLFLMAFWRALIVFGAMLNSLWDKVFE